MPADARSDIYALGVMLFELLSGALPFSGADPVDIDLQHIHQSVPSIHTVCPDVPEVLDLVLRKMLEYNPAKRYQRAGESAAAFERALQVMEATERSSTRRALHVAEVPQLTLPPTVNWFDVDALPSLIAGMAPASPLETTPHVGTSVPPQQSVLETSQLSPTTRTLPQQGVQPRLANHSAASQPGTSAHNQERPPVRLARTRGRPQPTRRKLRQVVKLIAICALVAGLFAVGEISLDHFVQSLKQAQQVANVPASAPNTTTQSNTPPTGTTQTSPLQPRKPQRRMPRRRTRPSLPQLRSQRRPQHRRRPRHLSQRRPHQTIHRDGHWLYQLTNYHHGKLSSFSSSETETNP